MKDLETPEQRAMEREMLRAAREDAKRGERDYSHIAIAIFLFIVATILYAIGYSGVAALVAVGFIVEMFAWIFLTGGGRMMPKADVPPVSAEVQRRESDAK